jgi:hypothetical protein
MKKILNIIIQIILNYYIDLTDINSIILSPFLLINKLSLKIIN